MNKKGIGLIELVVALMVLAAVLLAATAVFAPLLRSYTRAVDFAEANALLDSIATTMMQDISNATAIHPQSGTMATPAQTLTVITTRHLVFSLNNEGNLLWNEPFRDNIHRTLFEQEFLWHKSLNISWQTDDNGLFTLTLTLRSFEPSNPAIVRWTIVREYQTKPVAWQLEISN